MKIIDKFKICIGIFGVIMCLVFFNIEDAVAAEIDDASKEKIEEYIKEKMKEGNIPGMTVVIIDGNETVYSKGFGYADVENKIPVTSETSFEIASNSKAFTALAVLQLEKQGKLNLDDPVSKFFGGFSTTYKGEPYDITIRQMLHHTSGLPWSTITNIPISKSNNALEEMVENVNEIELNNRPGEKFEYATINYSIIGAIIQKVTGQVFEDYMKQNIFLPLGLKNTTFYPEEVKDTLAIGYKNGFFNAREYLSPTFRGNRPAGYAIMNRNDLERWLKLQLGIIESPLSPLIMETHIPDRTVKPSLFDLSSYAMGWAQYQEGEGEVSKAGLNPNFSAYMVFREKENLAVGILANNGTTLTYITGHGILDILRDKTPTSPYDPDQKTDKAWSVIAILISVYVLVLLILLVSVIIDIARKNRSWKPIGVKRFLIWLISLGCLLPFVYGIYLIPTAMQGVSWTTAIVWSPFSFTVAVIVACVALTISLINLIVYTLFPKKSGKTELPILVMLGLLSGAANAIIIFIISFSIGSNVPLKYLLYYFVLALVVYLFGRRWIEGKLVKITYNMIYEKRMELIDKVLKSPYKKMENMDYGKVIAALNNDTNLVGQSANVAVGFATSLLTIFCCFVYLGTISFYGTMLSLLVIAIIATLYSLISASADRYWEEARDTQNVYLTFIDHLLKGFKELSMHRGKKLEFRKDVEESSEQYRKKQTISRTKFTNAIVFGEALLILILGVVTFVFPVVFSDINNNTLISFVIVFLYLIGPVNGLLQAVPEILQIRVSWKRINRFIEELSEENTVDNEVAAGIEDSLEPITSKESMEVRNIAYQDLLYKYLDDKGEKSFKVGPITLEVQRGQIVFITGGNGSGKTTLAKLLTGLYAPQEGNITVNGDIFDYKEIGEHFSTVFSDYHLFERLYDIDCTNKQEEINRYLKKLELEEKVSIKDGFFSTLNLSTGQRKRLALLVCYLEGRPIYLFDEWAADQDPEYRKIFYHTLLPEMKAAGKIIFVITHDDHYFHVADRLIKMEMGQMKELDMA